MANDRRNGWKVDGFLRRWSRLKREVEDSDQPLEAERERPARDHDDDSVPPLGSLSFDSDFSPFLSDRVSEMVRRQALRKLFHMPAMNVVDGLDDYAEAFNNFEPLGAVVTHEMRRQLEREAKALLAEGEENEPPLEPTQAARYGGAQTENEESANDEHENG